MRLLFFLLFILMPVLSFAQNLNFKMPSDIQVYGNRVLVVDGLNNRISVLSLSGDKLYDITVPNPYGIYAEGNEIYVTNQEGKVYVLNSYGDIKKTIKVQGRPIDVVKVGNNLWITDGKDNCIKVIDLKGNVVKKIGEKGSAPGNFIGPFMIAKSKNFVFVVDSINARVQVFDFEGNLKASFGKFGIEKGDIFRPKGVAACGDSVLVSDAITGSVQMFTPFGGFEKVIAKNLDYPISISCVGDKVYILEMVKGKVVTSSLQGVN